MKRHLDAQPGTLPDAEGRCVSQEGRIARMLNETRQKVAMLGLLHLQFCDPTAHWKVLSSGLDQNVWTS